MLRSGVGWIAVESVCRLVGVTAADVYRLIGDRGVVTLRVDFGELRPCLGHGDEVKVEWKAVCDAT